VIEISEEFVEPMNGRQVLVPVAKVVLAKLARRISRLLQHLGETGRCGLQAERGAGDPDGDHAGPDRVLTCDECARAGRAGVVRTGP
jgi:hypothetical protein